GLFIRCVRVLSLSIYLESERSFFRGLSLPQSFFRGLFRSALLRYLDLCHLSPLRVSLFKANPGEGWWSSPPGSRRPRRRTADEIIGSIRGQVKRPGMTRAAQGRKGEDLQAKYTHFNRHGQRRLPTRPGQRRKGRGPDLS